MDKSAIIDIDNTLWHFCDALFVELRKINRNFPEPADWDDWDMWESYITKKEFYSAISAVHFNQDRDDYLPYPDAPYFLEGLKANGYHITIASHRLPETYGKTENWLRKNKLMYDDLHLSFNKTSLFNMFTSVVVDDSPEVLDKAHESGLMATGLLHPWNREYAENGFKLFGNLGDVLNYVLSS